MARAPTVARREQIIAVFVSVVLVDACKDFVALLIRHIDKLPLRVVVQIQAPLAVGGAHGWT